MAQILDDADPDSLISRLSRPLTSVADREAFRAAAQDALARVPCLGEGAVYRAVAALQRTFRSPPTDHRAHWDIERPYHLEPVNEFVIDPDLGGDPALHPRSGITAAPARAPRRAATWADTRSNASLRPTRASSLS